MALRQYAVTHPTADSAPTRREGTWLSAFYIDVVTFHQHYIEFQRDGTIRLFGGDYTNGPVPNSGYHGNSVLQTDHITGLQFLTWQMHYRGEVANHLHVMGALRSEFMNHVWLVWEWVNGSWVKRALMVEF